MIQVLGVDHEVPVVVREKFSISNRKQRDCLKRLRHILEEAVLLSTCNRTEIYFKSGRQYEELVPELFRALGWDMRLEKYIYRLTEKEAVSHLMYLSGGFHSVIVGEEQILSQIKSSYSMALEEKAVGKELSSLFKKSIRCGKEFRTKSKLHRVPVSASSIAISEARKRGMDRYMVIGYGEVGKLALKYILSSDFEKVYVVTKDGEDTGLGHEKVQFISYSERSDYYREVGCIISSTSAPHTVVDYESSLDGKLVFDLAVPRDVSDSVYSSHEIEVYNIDMLRRIDSENQSRRIEIMEENSWIIEGYIDEFYEWKSTLELTPFIKEMKAIAGEVVSVRQKTFRNKKQSKNLDKLVDSMIESTSNVYVNRAIEVMKSEMIEGRGEECLEIIRKIFCQRR